MRAHDARHHRGAKRAARIRAVGLPATLVAVVTALLALLPMSPAAARPAGLALAWGDNSTGGQLGDGNAEILSDVPVRVSLPEGTTVKDIAAGDSHAVALVSNGQVLAWGSNDFGQLGLGSQQFEFDVPAPLSLQNITAVRAGGVFSMALTSAGQVLTWGSNAVGQLGDGTNTPSNVPVPVSLPAGTTITAIAAGNQYSLALTSTGQVLAWGDNSFGQLGNGTTGGSSNVPVQVSLPTGTSVRAIAAGRGHSLAVTSTGQMLAWGNNALGQLGNGGIGTTSDTPVPVSLPSGTTVTAAGAGATHSVALTATGQVLAWGDNTEGELGNGSNNPSSVPVSVALPAGTTVTDLAVGGMKTFVVTSIGKALAWGQNSTGSLGDGSSDNSNVPVSVVLPADTTVTAVAGGQVNGYAITCPPASLQPTPSPTPHPPGPDAGDGPTTSAGLRSHMAVAGSALVGLAVVAAFVMRWRRRNGDRDPARSAA